MTLALERFPREIFKEIMHYTFGYTLELFEEANFTIEVLPPPILASHVCRSWRRALLSDPTMWTCIIFPEMSLELVLELLRRSGTSLLNVFLSVDDDYAPEMSYDVMKNLLSVLFQHIHRFRLLRVEIDVWERGPLPSPSDSMVVMAQLAVSYLQQPAPNLQTLSFWYNYLENDTDPSPDYTVINKLFAGDAPLLKRLHHRLSRDFEELYSPVFHNLSELRLNVPSDLKFNRLLDFLEASPRLKMLLLDVKWDPDDTVLAYLEQPSDRKVELPFLMKLVLEADFRVGLTELFLRHVILPSNIRWQITSLHDHDFGSSPSVSQFLSQRAHFTCLYVRAFPSFVQLTFQEELGGCANCFSICIVGINENMQDLVHLWDPMMHAFKASSRITHMEIEIGDSSYFELFPTFFTFMSNLRSLTIRPDIDVRNDSGPDEIRLFCLVALSLKYDELVLEGFEKRRPENPIQDPEMHVWSCPMLQDITIEFRDPLQIHPALMLYAIRVLLHREAGSSPQIFVYCPQTKQGVEESLNGIGADFIKIFTYGLDEE